ncbi:MAG: T9SS type A sorting domain-containing protein [Bacteroidetes bacterium]|nr:T9SS type A sorting domain-containing protein [Bacteroidota bacterium]
MKKLIFIAALILGVNQIIAQNSKIKVYFTKPVDNSISPTADGIYIPNMDDTVVSYINKANLTLDIAVYDNGSTKIVNAINSAYLRGVVVRYISTSLALNSALGSLNSGIQLLKRSSTDVMHNKFIIIDAGTAANSYLLTGSMNFTSGNIFDDPNNFIIIQDQALCQAYKTEFEEMWGSSTAYYNSANSKFGPQKTDNTQHIFNINGTNVEMYFSPSDGTTSKIDFALNTCNFSTQFAMFTFINNTLGDNIINLHNSGKDVKGIIENISYFGSEYAGFISNGIDVLSHENIPNSFHHKYGIVDALNSSSDPMVITGSHNWTNSAENDNDENTLIIHDPFIANQYYEEFMTRYNEMISSISEIESQKTITISPNPSNGQFKWKSKNKEVKLISISNSLGEIIPMETNSKDIILNNLTDGLYFLKFSDGKKDYFCKIIISK